MNYEFKRTMGHTLVGENALDFKRNEGDVALPLLFKRLEDKMGYLLGNYLVLLESTLVQQELLLVKVLSLDEEGINTQKIIAAENNIQPWTKLLWDLYKTHVDMVVNQRVVKDPEFLERALSNMEEMKALGIWVELSYCDD